MKPTSQIAILIHSVLAGLQVLNGGAAVGDIFGEKTAGLIALIVGAVQIGYSTYNQAVQVVPASAVAAVVDPTSGATLAGPAATAANGSLVDVTAQAPADQVVDTPAPADGSAVTDQ